MVCCASLKHFGPNLPQNLPNLNTFLVPWVLHLKLCWIQYLSILKEETVKLTTNSGPNTWSAPTSLGPKEAIFVTKCIKPNFFFWESKECLETKLSKAYKNFWAFLLVSSPSFYSNSTNSGYKSRKAASYFINVKYKMLKQKTS